MPVDLTHARIAASEKILVDRVSIFRAPGQWRGLPFDAETGKLLATVDGGNPAEESIAVDIAAKAKESGQEEQTTATGGAQQTEKEWEIALDYDTAPELAIGDVIVFTRTDDPLILDVRLYVSRVITGSLRVFRKVEACRRVDGVDQH